ncbi:hypothetical protein ENBRE01_1511, partial [Enteropsectra breve]
HLLTGCMLIYFYKEVFSAHTKFVMDLESCTRWEEYFSLKEKLSDADMRGIRFICKKLFLPQKTHAAIQYLYFASKFGLNVEPDDIVLFTSCIDLACKVGNVFRGTEKILAVVADYCEMKIDETILELYYNCINKTLVDICTLLDFNLELPDFYTTLENACKSCDAPTITKKRCWVFLNDVLTLPISLFVHEKEMAAAVLIMENMIADSNEDDEQWNDEQFSSIMAQHNMQSLEAQHIKFVISELYKLYAAQREYC